MGLAPVTIGNHEYELVPQRVPYLERKLSGTSLQDLLAVDTEGGISAFVGGLGDTAHGLLGVFIPNLMPFYEWKGFGSQEDYDAYVESEGADDRRTEITERGAPTIPEIVNAFQIAMAVNKVDLFKHLGNLVGGDFLRAAARKAIADSLTDDSSPSS